MKSKAAKMSFNDFKDTIYDQLENDFRVASIDDTGGWLTVKFTNKYVYHSKRELLRQLYRSYYDDNKPIDKVYNYLAEMITKDITKGVRKV